MTTKSKANGLADTPFALRDARWFMAADDELRRLNAREIELEQKNEKLMELAVEEYNRNELLEYRNEKLLDALRKCSEQLTRLGYSANHADAAIAKATGGE